ncbi:MAG: hypothetical protein IPP81_00595 [Chitinophagaceae bacterium]|nr:hypothetical protein [Chitinophagaceae bacterium]
MAINKNHEFEELDGVKCGIVEKNVPPARVEFLKKILEYNKFTVVVVPSPPPKVAAAPVAKVAEGEEAPPPPPPPAPETFTVGVTDYTYNPTWPLTPSFYFHQWCNRLHFTIANKQCQLYGRLLKIHPTEMEF